MVMAVPEAELEDEAAGRQHASKASVPAYSDMTALPPALFLFRSLPTPAAQGDDPEKFREPATRLMGSPVLRGAAPDAYSDLSSCRLLPSSLLPLSSSSLPPEEESSLSEELSTQHLARVLTHPKILTERRPPSISLKWRVSPSIKRWIWANVFHPRRRYIT